MAKAITTFRSHNLENLSPKTPIVLLLHGYGADENDLPEIISGPTPWVSPRAPLSSGGEGFEWYLLTPSNLAPKKEVELATEKLWSWIEETLPLGNPLIPIGFSQGALMATQLLRTRPERIHKTILLAGFILDEPLETDQRVSKLRPNVLYCHGELDPMISSSMVATITTWLEEHTNLTHKTYSGLGHSVDARVLKDVSEYLAKRA
jgi:phospholipase/carboxylesterase